MKFRDCLRILTSRGYELDRESSSHRVYKGMVRSKTGFVVVAYHRESERSGRAH